MDINVTGLSEEIIEKLDILANKKNISRDEFLYSYIMNISNQKEIFDVFFKYEKILSIVENNINENTEILNKVKNN